MRSAILLPPAPSASALHIGAASLSLFLSFHLSVASDGSKRRNKANFFQSIHRNLLRLPSFLEHFFLALFLLFRSRSLFLFFFSMNWRY